MPNKIKIAILGDSISTFSGYTERQFTFFDSYVQREAGITSVEDTWWMQVIHFMGGELLNNNSVAGSMVSGGVRMSGESEYRLKKLAINGVPDILLIYMGANDWGFSVLPEEFEAAYHSMLLKIKSLYPHTEIYCGTIMRGKPAKEPEMSFLNLDSCISPRIYSNIIRQCAKEAEVHIVNLDQDSIEYDTIDGIHPDKNGMKAIASSWIRSINSQS